MIKTLLSQGTDPGYSKKPDSALAVLPSLSSIKAAPFGTGNLFTSAATPEDPGTLNGEDIYLRDHKTIPMTARARRMRKIRPDLLFVALQRSQSMMTKILPVPKKCKPSSA